MVRSPLKRKKRLNPVSKKRIKINKEYSRLRAEFLAKHPYCQVWLAETSPEGPLSEEYAIANGGLFRLDSIPSQCPLATDIHHRKGRGRYLLDASTWMAVSRDAHRWIHDNPKEAMEKGYLLPR